MSSIWARPHLSVKYLLCIYLLFLLALFSGCTPKEDPAKAEDFYQKSLTALAQGNGDEELANLRKAHSFDPNNSQYTLKLTKILIQRGKFEETEKILTKALKIDAENVDLHLVSGENYITWAQQVKSIVDQGALADKAVLEFKFVLSKDPNHFDGMMFIANTFAHYPNMADFHVQAEKYFQRMLALGDSISDEQMALVYYYYGEFLTMKGRTDEAKAIWETGAKLYPENTLLKEKL